jgi:hypothetical protein
LILCALLFLASGFSALVYQVIWQRLLGLFSGVHVVSVTTIVAAFTAGLGFGGLLAAAFPHLILLRSEDLPGFALGSNEPLAFSMESIRARLESPAVQAYLESSGEGERTMRLLERFLDQVSALTIDGAERERLAGTEINTDLFPRDEFDKAYDGSYR